jgi:hypothetical protein
VIICRLFYFSQKNADFFADFAIEEGSGFYCLTAGNTERNQGIPEYLNISTN